MLQHMSKFPCFLGMNNIPLYVYTTFCLSTYLSKEHLGCFYLLALVSNAAMNMGEQISLYDSAFNAFVHIPGSGIAESYGNCF